MDTVNEMKNFGKTTVEEGHMVSTVEKRINMSMVFDFLFTRTS